jgi:hypothetical protein
MVPLFEFGCFPQTVFHPAIGMLDFVGLLLFRCPRGGFQFFGSGAKCMEFVLVPLPHIDGSLCKFGFKSGPDTLFVQFVFGLEQTEGFLGAQLGASGEVFDPQPVENLSTGEFASAEAQRAFDFLREHGRACGQRTSVRVGKRRKQLKILLGGT